MRSDREDRRRGTRLARAGLVAILVVAPAIRPGCAAELLGPAVVSFPVGNEPQSVVVGDFDADGVRDLAITNRRDNSVSILLGDGHGGFARTTDLAAGSQPDSLAIGDFNADGAQDLAVANDGANSVSILLGDGHGGFARTTDAVVESPPAAVATGDFNADGNQDLVVANAGASVGVLLGDGLGGFAHAIDFAVGNYPYALAIGDFNMDGAQDVAVVNLGVDPTYSGSVSILLGDGLGGFVHATDLAVGEFSISVAIGDLNADGAEDLAVANTRGNSVSVLFGDGHGGFVRTSDLAVGGFPKSVAIGDFNADGVQDLAVANQSDYSVSILLGDGHGSFARTPDLAVGAVPISLALSDFDADGAEDLAVVNFGTNSVSILPGDGLGGFTRSSSVAVGSSPWWVAVGDFNADGARDLAVANEQNFTVSVLLGDGHGGFSRMPDVPVRNVPASIAVGDFNADGAEDLAVANFGAGSLSILLGDGVGGFALATEVAVGYPRSVAIGDFNADGAKDLAVANQAGNSVRIFLGDGLGGFAHAIDLAVGNYPYALAIGDFNMDEAQDVAVVNLGVDPTYSGSVSILLGDRHGGFVRTPDLAVGRYPKSVAIGDFNADGVQDLAVANQSDYSVSILLGDGHGGFPRRTDLDMGYPSGPSSVAVSDFNADGDQDVAVAKFGQNTAPGSVSILLGDGLGGFSRTPDLTVGNSPVSVAIGDFNADGAPDLAVANDFSNSVSTLFGQLADRADTNGSNRIDGFDVAAIGRLAGARRCPAVDLGCGSAYRRNEDVNLDGIIDGDDLALVARRFGKLRKSISQLHSTVAAAAPPSAGTVALQQVASEADLLTVQLLVSDTTDAAAGASFAVTFEPTDGAPGQVFEAAGFEPGTYLSGDAVQAFDVDTKAPGTVAVTVSRLPNSDHVASSPQPLMSLFLRARRAGQARLDFAPFAYAQPALLNSSGQQVPVTFIGGLSVTVDASGGGPPGQQLGFYPDLVKFRSVELGSTSRKTLRISNFGYSDLEVSNLTSTLTEFSSFFTSAFTVPPYGFIEMPVLFTPARKGWFSGDLVIASNDAKHPETRVPVEGESGASLAVVPDRLSFGSVAAGSSRVLTLKLTNRGTIPLTSTGFASSDGQFVPRLGFTTLDPGQTQTVTVQFTPAASAVIRGTLTLSFDAPDVTTVVVGMVGAGY